MTGVRRVVGPFNRVEGDLEVTLEIVDDHVAAAYVNSPLYRGFEQILEGKAPSDALALVPRICGICSVAQSAAAARALADACGLVPTDNGRLAANLTLAVENLADHFIHFYLFFMPDFAAPEYGGAPWYPAIAERFAALTGSASREVLPARARWMQAMGILAGKWPHTLAVQPGGSTRPLAASDLLRLRFVLREFRTFLESRLFGAPLEAVAALDSVAALQHWRAQGTAGDFRSFLDLADALALWRLGESGAAFVSGGAYETGAGPMFAAGVWRDGVVEPLDVAAIGEDLSHARYAAGPMPQAPASGSTVPFVDKPGAYSWCKAPRLAGAVCETGALARQLVAGQPLICDVAARLGRGVGARVLARLIEFCRVLPAMEGWLEAFDLAAPWCRHKTLADACQGVGIVEAARGMLGHWLTVRQGAIHSYQIIAPTTWNFSPRDAAGRPGALEQALVGLAAPASGPLPARIHHVVRSFDPCMVCTVH